MIKRCRREIDRESQPSHKNEPCSKINLPHVKNSKWSAGIVPSLVFIHPDSTCLIHNNGNCISFLFNFKSKLATFLTFNPNVFLLWKRSCITCELQYVRSTDMLWWQPRPGRHHIKHQIWSALRFIYELKIRINNQVNQQVIVRDYQNYKVLFNFQLRLTTWWRFDLAGNSHVVPRIDGTIKSLKSWRGVVVALDTFWTFSIFDLQNWYANASLLNAS